MDFSNSYENADFNMTLSMSDGKAHNFKMWLDFWNDTGKEYLKYTPANGVLQYVRLTRPSYVLPHKHDGPGTNWLDPMDSRYLKYLRASESDGEEYRQVRAREVTIANFQNSVVTTHSHYRWRTGCSQCQRRLQLFRGAGYVCRHRDNDGRDEDRLYGIWQLGATNLRRELDAVIEGEAESETYVLQLLPRSNVEERAAADGAGSAPPYFKVIRSGQIYDLLLQTPPIPPTLKPLTQIHTQIGSIRSLVPDLQELVSRSYFWGNIDQAEAERLLANKPEGTFLVRASTQGGNAFAVSFRKRNQTMHTQIEQSPHHNYKLPTVAGHIAPFQDEEYVQFVGPVMSTPFKRPAPCALQELARAAIISIITYGDVDKLPIPPSAKSYLRKYHYVQAVRVRSLEPDLFAYMREDEELLFMQ